MNGSWASPSTKAERLGCLQPLVLCRRVCGGNLHHPLHALVAEVADEHPLRPGGDRRVREVTPRCLTPAQLTEAIVGAWGDPLVASAEDETVGQVDDHSLRILSSAREVAALDLRALVLCREEREVESDELDGMSLGIEDCMMQACPGREILKLLFALRVGLINRGDPSRVWPLKGRRNADQLACLIEKVAWMSLWHLPGTQSASPGTYVLR